MCKRVGGCVCKQVLRVSLHPAIVRVVVGCGCTWAWGVAVVGVQVCARGCVRTLGVSREQKVRVCVCVLHGLPHCECPVGGLAGCAQGSGVRGWWWGWGVGAAGGEPRLSRGGDQHWVSVCPQRAAGGPTVGPAAAMGKLRQGMLCTCLA